MGDNVVTLLDYGAGNILSLINAIQRIGYRVEFVAGPRDIMDAKYLIFPGVGAFGEMMKVLKKRDLVSPLKEYLSANRPFLGICLGLQALFEGSEEAPGEPGIGFFKGWVRRLKTGLSVPHIGWNSIKVRQPSRIFHGLSGQEKFYFVHSFAVEPADPNLILCTTDYGVEFVSGIQKGNIVAIQYHPEKSGDIGLRLLQNFLSEASRPSLPTYPGSTTRLAKRIVACLDVRADDSGSLVVTKGDQYDVRDKEKKNVRDLGSPKDLAGRYYLEGADEIAFLNITGFRAFPLMDMPMLQILKETSKNVFVPLTIGGGITAFVDKDGRQYSAIEVASEYFRSGADKVSIGTDAVLIAEEVLHKGAKGDSSIEEISRVYGSQAVVISIDPKRVYVEDPGKVRHRVIKTSIPGPNGERYCWFQCTIKGGREPREIDAITLAKVCEELGAGEILLNSIDRDGTNQGFDLELIEAVCEAVRIPVIASSGAGRKEHFLEVFQGTRAEAALAAGILHRRELKIGEIKSFLKGKLEIRELT